MTKYVEVDLGIVRGMAYYTGPVFEIFDIGKGMRAVAGGGRYDQLVQRIGGVDMPACGFAMGDMVITDLVRESAGPASLMEQAILDLQSVDLYIVLADGDKIEAALGLTQTLRDAGYRVLSSLSPGKVAKQYQAAEQSGAKFAILVGAEFPELSVRNLLDRSERISSLNKLLDDLAMLRGE